MSPYDIKKIRHDLGFNQTKFAEALNVSISTISNWETGRHNPSSDYSIKLSTIGILSEQPISNLNDSHQKQIDILCLWIKSLEEKLDKLELTTQG